jgi:hypothetical protein
MYIGEENVKTQYGVGLLVSMLIGRLTRRATPWRP